MIFSRFLWHFKWHGINEMLIRLQYKIHNHIDLILQKSVDSFIEFIMIKVKKQNQTKQKSVR